MVKIREKQIGNQTYFYIEHSMKSGSKVVKKELYLGKEIPKDIEEIKIKFMKDIMQEKFYSELHKIKETYAKEQKRMPVSAKEKEQETFATKFTYNTQRIEGSTLTLKETANLLERGILPSSRPSRDVKEAEAHRKLFFEAMAFKKDLSFSVILDWHRKLFLGTKPDIAGKVRNHQVAISGSRFMPPFPAELNALLNEFFEWYNKNKNKMQPIELAALVHLKFVTIHPFTDGNGRLSRLMMNFVLHKHKFPLFDIQYEGRNSYYTALERAQIKKNEWIFVNWFFKNYIKEMKRNI